MMARVVIVAAALGLGLSACNGHVQEVAVAQGATDLDCPDLMTRAWFRAPGSYVVRGCGRSAELLCEETPDGPKCALQGQVTDWQTRQLSTKPSSVQSEIDLAFERVSPRIIKCLQRPRSIRLPASILTQQPPDLTEVGLSDAEQECVRGVLTAAERPHALSVPVWELSEDDAQLVFRVLPTAVFTIPAEARAMNAPPASAAAGSAAARAPAAPPPPSAPASPAQPQAEARLRDAIKSQGEAILLCVNRPVAVVRADYFPSGEVRAGVQGIDPGSAEERCVQDVLHGFQVDPTPTGGQVLQVVRRHEAP